MIVTPPAGFMSVIAVSAAMTVEIYGFSIQQYGLIFCLRGDLHPVGRRCESLAGDPL